MTDGEIVDVTAHVSKEGRLFCWFGRADDPSAIAEREDVEIERIEAAIMTELPDEWLDRAEARLTREGFREDEAPRVAELRLGGGEDDVGIAIALDADAVDAMTARSRDDDRDRGRLVTDGGVTNPRDESPQLRFCDRCVSETLHSWSGADWLCDSCGRRAGQSEHSSGGFDRDWRARALLNVDEWGQQSPGILVLAMIEELGEIAIELEHDDDISTGFPPRGIEDPEEFGRHLLAEMADLGRLTRSLLEDSFDGPVESEDDRVAVCDESVDVDSLQEELDDLAPLLWQMRWSLEGGEP